jgi:regulation of enolase protein 1 (concanavalin A-like superfamily)
MRTTFTSLVLCLIAPIAVAQKQQVSAEKEPITLKGFGEVAGPDEVCTIVADEGKLAITVPGGLYDLNPAHEGTSAPRVLQDVEGDFTAEVKVTGEFNPGTEASGVRARPFNSGGILLWQDAKNYIRLERNSFWIEEQRQRVAFTPLVEYFRNGEEQGANPGLGTADFFKGRSTWLRLARKGTKITASYSHDGQAWAIAQEFDAALKPKLRIGVAVINTAKKPLVVEFTDFKVTK